MSKTASDQYPKQLYSKGWEDLSATVVVHSVEEEEAANKEGFKHLSKFTEKAEAKAPAKEGK